MSIRKGNVVIAGNIDAVYATDEQTITVNQDEKLQVIGTINKNNSLPKYDWVGTKAEYDDLEQIHDDWLYFITDDTQEAITLSNCVGQIIQAICTSSYIPNGCIPCDGTEYTADRFIDFWTNYLTSQPAKILTCTYNEYNTEITTYGQCAKFAVDTSSQKFKAPTIKDGSFIQQAMSDSELGKAYNAGLPNITYSNSGYTSDPTIDGPLQQVDRWEIFQSETTRDSRFIANYSFDASRSSSIYGNSDTVQPNAVALRFFVVVVDTYLNQSQLDWTTYTQSLNNKADKNLVNTDLITNCITEMPQNIKLELANGVLTLKAGSKIYMPAGFETDGTTKKFTTITTANDLTVTHDYNGDMVVYISHMTTSPVLTLAALNGDTGSGTGTGTGYYYSTDYNKIYVHGIEYDGCSFPIAIVRGTSVEIESINQVFNGFGYIGNTVYSLPGITYLIPNGKNTDNTYNSLVRTTSQVIVHTLSVSENSFYCILDQDSVNGWGNYQFYIADRLPSLTDAVAFWYDTKENIIKWTNNTGVTWTQIYGIILGELVKAPNTNISNFNPKQKATIIDAESTDYIVSYKRPTAAYPTWYRIYKSGWVEQGGIATGNGTVTLPIPMNNTNYFISLTGAASSIAYSIDYNSKTTSGFTIYSYNTRETAWEVKGFMAQ